MYIVKHIEGMHTTVILITTLILICATYFIVATRYSTSPAFVDWVIMLIVVLCIAYLMIYGIPGSSFEPVGVAEKFDNDQKDKTYTQYMDIMSKIVPVAKMQKGKVDDLSAAKMDTSSIYNDTKSQKTSQQLLPKKILSSLTVFITTLSKLSWDSSTVTKNTNNARYIWKNLASRSSYIYKCGGTQQENSGENFFLSSPPSMDADKKGIILGSNVSISGPESHQLGIDINRAMTVFFVSNEIQPQTISTLFQIYANTRTNNGISMHFFSSPIDPLTSYESSMVRFQVGVRIGDDPIVQGNGDEVRIPRGDDCLWVLTKSYDHIRIYMTNLRSKNLDQRLVVDFKSGSHPNIILSNLNMTINGDLSWNTSLLAFGIATHAFDTADVHTISVHYRELFRNMDPELIKYRNELDRLKGENSKLKACPYDKATCEVCKGEVKNWGSHDWYLGITSGECSKAIASFCSKNPSHLMCGCWNTSDSRHYSSNACLKYRSFFENTKLITSNMCPKIKQPVKPPEKKEEVSKDVGKCEKEKKKDECDNTSCLDCDTSSESGSDSSSSDLDSKSNRQCGKRTTKKRCKIKKKSKCHKMPTINSGQTCAKCGNKNKKHDCMCDICAQVSSHHH